MGDNAVNKSINISMEDKGGADEKRVNSFADAIEALAKAGFEDHSDQMKNLSGVNIVGQLRCEIINNWKHQTYGYRHDSLDLICERMPIKSMSRSGYGLGKLIELIKGINASFEQNDAIRAFRDNMLNQRR